jgi:hypothetical protein
MAVLSAVPIDQHDLPPNLVQAASLLMNVITLNCPGGDDTAPDAATAAAMEAVGSAPPAGSASVDTLNASDKAIGTATSSSQPSAADAPPAAPIEPPKEVHVIEINEPPPPKPSEPQQSGGMFGWLGGLWQNMFK